MTREKFEKLQNLLEDIDDVKDFVKTYDTFKEGTDSGAEPVKLQLVVHRGGRDHASVTLNGKFDICKHIMDLMHSYLEELENDFKNS